MSQVFQSECKKNEDGEEYVVGYCVLNELVLNNLGKFSLEIKKDPISATIGCLKIAREEFINIPAITLLADYCYDDKCIELDRIIECCFYEGVENPLLGHFIDCIRSYVELMTKNECIDWLKSHICELGGSKAAHLILCMEVGKC